jgi:hypothetical protein
LDDDNEVNVIVPDPAMAVNLVVDEGSGDGEAMELSIVVSASGNRSRYF